MCAYIDSVVDGHYLNLPVMNDPGEIVGMVDVLKLTYATLEQVNVSIKFCKRRLISSIDQYNADWRGRRSSMGQVLVVT